MACTCLNTTIGRDFPLTSRGLFVPPPNEEPRNTGKPVAGSRSENPVQKHAVLYSKRNSSCMRGSYRELCSASPELLGELLLLDTHTETSVPPTVQNHIHTNTTRISAFTIYIPSCREAIPHSCQLLQTHRMAEGCAVSIKIYIARELLGSDSETCGGCPAAKRGEWRAHLGIFPNNVICKGESNTWPWGLSALTNKRALDFTPWTTTDRWVILL